MILDINTNLYIGRHCAGWKRLKYRGGRKRKGNGGKRLAAALLLLALAVAQVGCGETEINTGFRILEVIGVRRYSLIFRLDDKIAPEVNSALEHLAYNGQLGIFCFQWLGWDGITLQGSAPAPAEQTSENSSAEGEGQSRRTLIIGVEKDFYPMSYDSNGEPAGMNVDIALALGTELGWDIRIQPITPAEVGTQLSAGNIDCALGFDPASVDGEKYTVGHSYLDSDILLAVRQESQVKRVKDIRGERIGTVDDPAVTRAVRENENITKYASGATVYLSARRCISAMDNGWCAAVVMDAIMLENASR